MIIGLLVLIVAFIVSCVALCCSLNIPLLPFVGALLILVGKTASRAKTCSYHKKKQPTKGGLTDPRSAGNQKALGEGLILCGVFCPGLGDKFEDFSVFGDKH